MQVKVTQSCSTSTRLLCPWYSPGKSTGVGYHPLLQGIFLTQGSNLVSHTAGRFFTIWATREALLERLYKDTKTTTLELSVHENYKHWKEIKT